MWLFIKIHFWCTCGYCWSILGLLRWRMAMAKFGSRARAPGLVLASCLMRGNECRSSAGRAMDRYACMIEPYLLLLSYGIDLASTAMHV